MIVRGIEIGDREMKADEFVGVRSSASGLKLTPDGAAVATKSVATPILPKALEPKAARAAAEAAGIPWRDTYADRVVSWKASDETVDRDGDIIVQAGWDLENFKRNPIHLWDHQWDTVPIGMAIVAEVRSYEEGAPGLGLDILYPDAETWESSERVLRLLRAGFLRTGSVGFLPKRIIHVADDAVRASLGLGRYGVVIAEAELVEFSVTPVPSNVGAQVTALHRSAKNLRSDDLGMVRELARLGAVGKSKNEDWKNTDTAIVSAWRLFFPEVTSVPDAKSVDAPIPVEGSAEIMKRLDGIDALLRELHSASEPKRNETKELLLGLAACVAGS